MTRNAYPAVSAIVTAVLTVAIVAAFAALSTGAGTEPIDAASSTVAVLQIAAVLVVATLAFMRPRTRLFGWMGLVVAVIMTVFVIVVGAVGVGSGVSMAMRPPLGLVGILAFALFDTGRMSTRVDRLVTVPAATAGIGIAAVIGLTASVTPGAWAALPCTDSCAPYGLGLVSAGWWSTTLQVLFSIAQATAAAGCIAGLAQRMRTATGWRRTVMLPVGWAGIAYAAVGLALMAPVLAGIDTGVVAYAEPVLVVRRLLLPLAIGGGMILALVLQRQATRTALPLFGGTRSTSDVEDAVQRLLADPGARVLPTDAPGPARPGFARTDLRGQDGQLLGMLEHRVPRDEEDDIALGLAAPAAALAMDRLRVRETVEAASAAERARIERDLHDGLQQHLVAMRMRMSVLEASMQSGDAAAAGGLDDLILDTERALEELRALARGERRAVLHRQGLRGALEDAAATTGLDVRLSGVTTERLPAPVEEALYFACREALQNAMKHGSADAPVIVSVQSEGADVLFEVSDIKDTRVPEAPADTPRTIAERIMALGGTTRTFASASGGRRVTGRMPLRAASREHGHAR